MEAVSKNLNQESNYIVQPKKFALWVMILSMVMLFAAFTSGYIVRRAEGNWDVFPLPMQFLYSIVIVVFSSITMQWAYMAAKRDNFGQVKTALLITLALGLAFCGMQAWGAIDLSANGFRWTGMNNPTPEFVAQNGVTFVGAQNPASTFIYIISGSHLAHVLGGIIFLIVMVYNSFKLNIHKGNLVKISMCATYWHFVGVLWIYLYLFLFLNR